MPQVIEAGVDLIGPDNGNAIKGGKRAAPKKPEPGIEHHTAEDAAEKRRHAAVTLFTQPGADETAPVDDPKQHLVQVRLCHH